MKTVAIIQARMNSTRLPGKVMKKIKNKTVLEHVINRVSNVSLIDEIVIATTTNSEDILIESLAITQGVSVYRGNEHDVLSRYYEAAVQFGADNIVRITSDCPLIDPTVTSEIIQFYLNNDYDYVSNCLVRSYPRGLDTEVLSFRSLEKAYKEAIWPEQKEHVTPYIYQNRNVFNIYDYISDTNLSNFRWTLDTKEDLELIFKIYEALYDENSMFGLNEIISLMERNQELTRINAHIEQKKI